MGASLGFLTAWQPLGSQAIYTVTKDNKDQVIPGSKTEFESLFGNCCHILLVANK